MIPKLQFFKGLICFTWLMSMGACGNQDIISEHSVDISKQGWDTDFEVSIENISSENAQKAIVKIVHAPDYGFENLYLSALLLQNRDTIYNDLVNVNLMDDLGIWIGEQHGENLTVRQTITSINPSLGPISLYIKQYSREKLLQNIESMSLVLSR